MANGIEFKTEGKLLLEDAKQGSLAITPNVAVTWVNGGDKVYIHSGREGIALSKRQLLMLGNYVEQIADHIQPNMHSLPTFAKE